MLNSATLASHSCLLFPLLDCLPPQLSLSGIGILPPPMPINALFLTPILSIIAAAAGPCSNWQNWLDPDLRHLFGTCGWYFFCTLLPDGKIFITESMEGVLFPLLENNFFPSHNIALS